MIQIGVKVHDQGFRVYDSGLMINGLRFTVYNIRSSVQIAGLGVMGLGFGAPV